LNNRKRTGENRFKTTFVKTMNKTKVNNNSSSKLQKGPQICLKLKNKCSSRSPKS